jgi:hypothetical protein
MHLSILSSLHLFGAIRLSYGSTLELSDANSNSQTRFRKDQELQRRRLSVPAAESAGYNVFRQEVVPFAEPSDDSSKSSSSSSDLKLHS